MKGTGNKGHQAGGFTLLEIMIALAIIGITLAVVIHTVNYHADVSSENALITRMFLLAKEKIIEMEMNPKNSRGTFPGTDITYENTIRKMEYMRVIELKTTIRSHDREVTLSEFIIRE